MNGIKLRSQGFTIVELLIVIVVIAVLASIAIVAFNGVSNRAHASKAGSAVTTFQKLLELHKAQNGVYPDPGLGGANMACVGQVSDYPAADGFESGECDNEEGVTNLAVSAQLNNALSPYASSMPNGKLPPQFWDNEYPQYGKVRGITYRYFGPSSYRIYYSLPGIQQCPSGTTSHDTDGAGLHTDCTVSS